MGIKKVSISIKTLSILIISLVITNANGQRLINSNNTYRIGVLLPFTATVDDEGNIDKQQQLISYAMMDFYGGIQLALENLSKLGFSADVYTWNTQGKSTESIKKITESVEFNSLDLLIGPIDDKLALEISKTNSALIQVSPLKYIKSNSQTINFFQKKENRFESVMEGVFNRFPNYKICVISKDPQKSKNLVTNKFNDKNNRSSISYHNYKSGSIKPNIPNGDDIILVIDGISQTQKLGLTKRINRKANSYIIADHTWFDNFLPTEEVDESLIIYPTVNYIFGLDSATQEFSKQYIDSFHAEPSRFGYQGYDQMWFLGNALLSFGKDFTNFLPNAEYFGTINTIALRPSDVPGVKGLVNRGIRFIYRKESELICWD